MAKIPNKYDPKVILENSKKLIVDKKLIFIDDLVAYLGLTRSTFYAKIKVDSDEMNELKTLIDQNKIALKVSIRKKWFESDNFASQMALYKLTATKEELKRLSTSYVEDGEDTAGKTINVAFKWGNDRAQSDLSKDNDNK